jgi:hypothetical protein
LKYIGKLKPIFVVFKLCTNKNHSYKHNEQINKQYIDNSECFGVKFVKIYPCLGSPLVIVHCTVPFVKKSIALRRVGSTAA